MVQDDAEGNTLVRHSQLAPSRADGFGCYIGQILAGEAFMGQGVDSREHISTLAA
jgi:hypothetical protein